MNLADEIKSHVKELQFAVFWIRFLTLFRWICPSSIVFSEYKILNGKICIFFFYLVACCAVIRIRILQSLESNDIVVENEILSFWPGLIGNHTGVSG